MLTLIVSQDVGHGTCLLTGQSSDTRVASQSPRRWSKPPPSSLRDVGVVRSIYFGPAYIVQYVPVLVGSVVIGAGLAGRI